MLEEVLSFSTSVNVTMSVIFCGGPTTHPWPLSRSTYPKQYVPLVGNGEHTQVQLVLSFRCDGRNGRSDISKIGAGT